jgi:tetratricopeptide (TPR) repeat protein
VTLWTDAESKDHTSPKIYSNFGDACTTAGDYPKAIELLNRAIALNNTYPDAYYNRGLAWYYVSVNNARANKPVHYQEAIADYTRAIELKPNLSQAWYNRAGTYFTIGKPKEALADALKAQELGYPVDPMFFKVLKQQNP